MSSARKNSAMKRAADRVRHATNLMNMSDFIATGSKLGFDLAMKERKALKAKFTELLKGCMKCDWDEAEGGLFLHCKACQLEVTRLAYRVFVLDEKLTIPPNPGSEET